MTAYVVALLALLLGPCVGTGAVAAGQREVTEAPGTITEVNAAQGWYGIVPDSDRTTRFAPDALPEEFRKDGLRVVFSGRVGPIDPNVRAWGIPLALTHIRRE